MTNPFTAVLSKLALPITAQGSGYRDSFIYCLMKTGEALHDADPTAWNASSLTAADEVLFRLRALNLGTTFAYAEMARVFAENYR